MPPVTVLDIGEDSFELIAENFKAVLEMERVKDLPIVVLSICGCMREGKSFVLNYFIRYLRNEGKGDWFNTTLEEDEMFPSKHRSDRVTTGINIWSEPFVTDLKGKKVAVILLDTQGLFDEKTAPEHNQYIFSFCCILSSFMVYNVKTKIDDGLLENVAKYSSYVKAIGKKLPGREDTGTYLLFLLRDFASEKEYEFGFHNKNECPKFERKNQNYFDFVFTHTHDMKKKNREFREEIQNSYSDIGMYLLPYPGESFSEGRTDEASEEVFYKVLKEFVEHTMSHLVTKKVGAEEVTGQSLQTHIQEWAELCKSKEFPEADDVAELAMSHENHGAYVKALEDFQRKCALRMPSLSARDGKEKLQEELLHPLVHEAVNLYKESRTLGTERDVRKYVLKLSATCVKYFNENLEKLK